MALLSSNNIVINSSGGLDGSPTAKGTERTPLLSGCQTTTPSLNQANNHEASLVLNNNSVDMGTGVSWGVAAFLLVNTALGAGMLNYPYAYNQIGGVLAAALIQVVSSF